MDFLILFLTLAALTQAEVGSAAMKAAVCRVKLLTQLSNPTTTIETRLLKKTLRDSDFHPKLCCYIQPLHTLKCPPMGCCFILQSSAAQMAAVAPEKEVEHSHF